MKSALVAAAVLLCGATAVAAPAAPIRVSGRHLVDDKGNCVRLAGAMHPFHPYFCGSRWGWGTDDAVVERCLDYFDRLTTRHFRLATGNDELHIPAPNGSLDFGQDQDGDGLWEVAEVPGGFTFKNRATGKYLGGPSSGQSQTPVVWECTTRAVPPKGARR